MQLNSQQLRVYKKGKRIWTLRSGCPLTPYERKRGGAVEEKKRGNNDGESHTFLSLGVECLIKWSDKNNETHINNDFDIYTLK